jgi:hypothetical protein
VIRLLDIRLCYATAELAAGISAKVVIGGLLVMAG